MPSYDVAVHSRLAHHVRAYGVEHGFDLALCEEFGIDHSFMVPLHFLNAGMRIPVVPIWVNGFVPPLPSSQRCHAFGVTVRAAIEAWQQPLRVAAIGSGSFSLEIGGPKAPVGARSGVPDPEWAARVQDNLAHARIALLVEETTRARLAQAGNAAGEVLNWIAMLGVIGNHKPVFIEPQLDHGDAFAVWRWD